MAWQDNEANFREEDFTEDEEDEDFIEDDEDEDDDWLEDEDDDELYYYMDEDGNVDWDAYIHDQDSDYPMCGDWS